MSSDSPLERRVAALEAEVAELRKRLANRPANWIEKIAGSISDEAAFDEALKYGRAFRQADRPIEDGTA